MLCEKKNKYDLTLGLEMFGLLPEARICSRLGLNKSNMGGGRRPELLARC